MATTTERGYGRLHQLERARVARVVDRGEACCARCGRWIAPGSRWHLGHDPHDPERRAYAGPMCVRCNCDTRLEKALRRPRVSRSMPERWL